MEFLELLFGAPELCGCTIQLFAALMDVWAGVSTVRYVKAAKANKPRPSIERVLCIVVIAIVATMYVVTSIILSNVRR